MEEPIEYYRTHMCRSIDNGEKCTYGDRCRFAHSLSQLNIQDCPWGNGCKIDYKPCRHKHPYEDLEQYYVRTGLIRYKGIQIEKTEELTWNPKRILERPKMMQDCHTL
jgi:hypothetical protein